MWGSSPTFFFLQPPMSVDALLAPIRAHLAGLGFELVDLRRVGTVERPILQVRVDRPDSRPGQGITADDCAGISRSLERFLESSAMVGPRYVLEVSSPASSGPCVGRSTGVASSGSARGSGPSGSGDGARSRSWPCPT